MIIKDFLLFLKITLHLYWVPMNKLKFQNFGKFLYFSFQIKEGMMLSSSYLESEKGLYYSQEAKVWETLLITDFKIVIVRISLLLVLFKNLIINLF